MERFCMNSLCENPGAKEVPVSVEKPADQVRTLCCPCHESYTWGVQHGRMTAESKPLWILAVADSGIIAHVQVYVSQAAAQKGLVKYLRNLRKYHGYKGPDSAEAVHDWLESHEHLSAEITEQHSPKECSGPNFVPVESRLQEHLRSFLDKGGFVVLGKNRQAPEEKDTFKAWAYQGPPDFQEAKPVTFGRGKDVSQSLDILDSLLASLGNNGRPDY